MIQKPLKPEPASVLTFKSTQVENWLSGIPGFIEMLGSWRLWSGKINEYPHELFAFEKWLRNAKAPTEWATLPPTKGLVLVRSENSGFKKIESRNQPGLWKVVAETLADCYSRESARNVLSSGKDPGAYIPQIFIQPLIPALFSGRCLSRVGWEGGPKATFASGNIESFLSSTNHSSQIENQPFEKELLKIAKQLESEAQHPISFEWSWTEKKELYILSPIIPLETKETKVLAYSLPNHRKWDREMAQERYPETITTLGWTAIEDLIDSNLDALFDDFGIATDRSTPMAIRYQGIIYSDSEYFKYPGRAKIKIGRYLFSKKGAKAFWALIQFFLRLSPFRNQKLSRAFLKMDVVEAALLSEAEALCKKWPDHLEKSRAALTQLSKEIDQLDNSLHLTLAAMEKLRSISVEFLKPDLSIYVIKDSMNKALQGVWKAIGGREADLYQILSSFDRSQSIEMGEDWTRLVNILKKDPDALPFLSCLEEGPAQPASPETLKEWNLFLEKNGHTRTDWDIARPSWRENPSLMVPLLRSMMQGSGPSRALKTQDQIADFRTALKRVGLNEKEIAQFESRVKILQDYMRMDEELRFYSGLLLEPSRRLVLKAAKELVRIKIIADEKDVFFLTLSELKKSLKDPTLSRIPLVERRRAEWELELRETIPLTIPPLQKVTAAIESSSSWKATAASPGIAKGPAFFLEHLEQASELPKGAILLTTSPNPAFVPLYPALGAIITKTGGSLSHGFVAAREYGLPAVSGFDWNRDVIGKGDWLEVDGSTGTIKRVQND